jgi:precorrin-6Y C5,15-methyltransferase (decarboxylating)
VKKLVIFAGTTEGRRLSEILADAGIAHTVCVATEYGEIVMREQTESTKAMQTAGQPIVNLHCGRMDREQMQKFLHDEGYEIVVDATHPYARVVTENLRGAVDTLKSLEKDAHFPIYLRLERKIDGITEADGIVTNVQYFENNADCAKALENTEGNILLTTGSKELAVYCASGRLNDRLYVRILPGRESLELCMEQGIKGRQILALQGPFSTEMNAAILKQYDIHHMVTKNSGRTGGYQEKLEAAKILGIPVYVIQPVKKAVDTYSFAEICGKLEQLCDCKLSGQGSMEICLAGIGMGSKDGQTQEVQHAIETADILLGAERMIERYSAKIEKRPYYMTEQILPYLEQLQKNGLTEQKDPLRVTVLFSGDTGFYSGCRKLYVALQEAVAAGALNAGVRILPGISSVATLAARVGESYEDAAILSMHGKKLNRLSATVESHEKVFLLTSGSEDIRKIGHLLAEAGLTDCEVIVGYQLSYPEESIRILTPGQCEEITEEGLYTCLIRNPHWQPERLTHGRADTCFLRDAKTPMTKEEVREVSICKLNLTQNAVVYDIGSGTGSVAIEIAGVPGGVQVYAIERKPEAVELLRKNREHFHMDNIQIIEAPAPEGLEELPVPTHAFIGGSGGRLLDILQTLYRKNPHMRIVINAISMETIAELKEVLDTFPVEEEEILQMQVSRVKKLLSYHLPQAENPVWICSFTFRETGTDPMDNAKKTKQNAGETGNGKNGEVQR